jgi:hypothetical protein
MIKVDVIRKDKEGTTMLVFETRDVSPRGLELFDEAYAALMSNRLKDGGYTDSNRFEIEVKDD